MVRDGRCCGCVQAQATVRNLNGDMTGTVHFKPFHTTESWNLSLIFADILLVCTFFYFLRFHECAHKKKINKKKVAHAVFDCTTSAFDTADIHCDILFCHIMLMWWHDKVD